MRQALQEHLPRTVGRLQGASPLFDTGVFVI